MAELLPVQQQIAALLQAGHTLTVRWDCGGDESFVYTQLDGQELRPNYENSNDLAWLLDVYLTDRLELPDAGEFQLAGTGRIFREGSEVLIEYQSQATVYWEDFGLSDEELQELGVVLPNRTSPPNEDVSLGSSATDEAEESAGTFDQNMSDEYSGRKVLFTLP